MSAVYHYRLDNLDRRRLALLAAHPPSARPRPVSELVDLMLMPFVEEVETAEGGRYFIRFLSQMLSHPKLDLVNLWRSRLNESLGTVFDEMHQALPDVPVEIFGHRFGLMWLLAVNTLADRERINVQAETTLKYKASPALFISNLRDTLTGLIAAPVSATTRSEISRPLS